jgi:transposase
MFRMLEYVPASFVVIRHVRTKLSCTKCDCVVQAEAASRPIERGLAGPGLLAHVLASKYCGHQPLYRQSEIHARQGVELERSTMADWVGGIYEAMKMVAFNDLRAGRTCGVTSTIWSKRTVRR